MGTHVLNQTSQAHENKIAKSDFRKSNFQISGVYPRPRPFDNLSTFQLLEVGIPTITKPLQLQEGSSPTYRPM